MRSPAACLRGLAALDGIYDVIELFQKCTESAWKGSFAFMNDSFVSEWVEIAPVECSFRLVHYLRNSMPSGALLSYTR